MKIKCKSKSKIKKDWKAYCKTSFNALSANIENWGIPEFYRPITRIYYINVFDCGLSNFSGLISENALTNKVNGKKVVHDHCLSPQFIGRMIMDNPDKYLKNYSDFESIFWESCKTILVTQEENFALAALTENNGDDYKIYVPTDKKYNHLNINLHFRPNRNGRWSETVHLDTNMIDTPKNLLEYEKQYIVTSITNDDATFCYESRKIDY